MTEIPLTPFQVTMLRAKNAERLRLERGLTRLREETDLILHLILDANDVSLTPGTDLDIGMDLDRQVLLVP